MGVKKNDDVILGCALRYALGRRTYVTTAVSNFIIDNVKDIDWHLIPVMIKDIEDCKDYGDPVDEQAWMKLLKVLKEEMKEHDKSKQYRNI